MINIINTTNCVLLLQDFAITKTPAKYAIKADHRYANKVLQHINKDINPGEYLSPQNIRIMGHYETLDEAKFILRKLRKGIDHDNAQNRTTCDSVVHIDTTSFNNSEHSYTPVYTNGVSNVMHHLEELSASRVDSFIRMHTDNPESTLTFRQWVLLNETI